MPRDDDLAIEVLPDPPHILPPLPPVDAPRASLFVPLLVGVLPLVSVRHAAFLHNEVPGITIPAEFLERMQEAGSKAAQEGIGIALELVEQMRTWASGIYLMPQFSRYDLAAEIIDQCRIRYAQIHG
jgi:homocysteine S-methyltransferase